MVQNGPFGKASPAWYQRLATMSWKETLRTFNPTSLFALSGVAMVGLAVVNEWLVDVSICPKMWPTFEIGFIVGF